MNRRTKRTLPRTQIETIGHDLAGDLVRSTNFNGVVITNQYDVMNRLTNRASVGGYQVTFAYSQTGQRTSMTDPSGSMAYAYDSRDRLTNKVVSWSSGPAISLSYLYDANGNVTNIVSSSTGGVNLQYQLDPLNRITNVLAGGAAAASYGFDPNGNLQSVRYGNGATNLYQYDALNRLTNSIWKSNQLTLGSFYYQLGATGNRTNLTETLLTSVTSRTYAWTYDSLYRLTNENISGIGSASYGLDKVGNRTNRTAGLDGLPAQNFSYSANDWVTTNAYDPNGNTLWTTNGGVATGPYLYNVEDRLTNFNNSVLLGYDGDGIRVKKTANGTNFFYLIDDLNPTSYAQVLEEWAASSGVTNLSRVFNYGLAPVSQISGSTVCYLVPDGHGSTRLLTDGSGAVLNTFAYDAYGALIASNGVAQTAYLYCGEQFDADLDMYYLRARYCKPEIGRFWTMDKFEGNQPEPLSLQKYLYCKGDPVGRADPSGQDDCDIVAYSLNFFPLGFILGKTENDFTPNWSKGVGPVTHTKTSVNIGFPRSAGSADKIAAQMYHDLQMFNYFNEGNTASARVAPGHRVFFTSLKFFGLLSNRINPTEVAVQAVDGPGANELSAMTLGHHMVVGVRRWRIIIVSAQSRILRVETEAYEQSNGYGNRVGRWLSGQDAQYLVWETYLHNIASHWVNSVGARSGEVLSIPAEEVGSDNPWRSQLPKYLQ